MSKTCVVNRRVDSGYDVYIGRPSIWANPFSHVESKFTVVLVSSRAEAIRCYREWIMTQPQLLARLPELKGKVLGCWCHPKPCHGDVLAELADAL